MKNQIEKADDVKVREFKLEQMSRQHIISKDYTQCQFFGVNTHREFDIIGLVF